TSPDRASCSTSPVGSDLRVVGAASAAPTPPCHLSPRIRIHREELDDVGAALAVLMAVAQHHREDRVAGGLGAKAELSSAPFQQPSCMMRRCPREQAYEGPGRCR